MKLETALLVMAVLQAGVALLNLGLVHILKWKPDLNKLPLLIREVFYIHSWFISITLAIFAALTWRFAQEMSLGEQEIYRWIGACISIFWGTRAVMQVTWYSSIHWKGKAFETFVHIALLLTYGALALTYAGAALKGHYECLF